MAASDWAGLSAAPEAEADEEAPLAAPAGARDAAAAAAAGAGAVLLGAGGVGAGVGPSRGWPCAVVPVGFRLLPAVLARWGSEATIVSDLREPVGA